MTKEQAIKFANCLKNNYTIDFNDMADFCDTVIEALEQQPCEDCVSRAELKKWLDMSKYEYICPNCGAEVVSKLNTFECWRCGAEMRGDENDSN